MTTIKELEEVAKLISPYAYIAGGFYKDIFNGKEPKDIDVFMVSQKNYKVVVAILENYENTKAIKSKVATKVGRFEIVRPMTVFKRRLWGNPETVVESFDMSIAMVYIDENGLTKVNQSIDLELYHNEFIAYLYDGDEERTEERIKRYENYGYTCINRIKKDITIYGHFIRHSHFKSKSNKRSIGSMQTEGCY